MKKFILNALSIYAWIYQVLCVIDVVMFTIMIVGMAVLRSNPDFRKGFASAVDIKGVSVNRYMWVMIVMLILSIVMFVAIFLICRYARLIVKNIKQEIYFANTNLNLIKKMLIFVAVNTVVTLINYCVLITHHAWFNKYINNIFYPNGITNGLLFLAVLYVIYLVFKYGMKVQEDADSII